MGMKNFLRPTKYKIIVSIVLFFVLAMLPIVPCMKGTTYSYETMLNLHFGFCTVGWQYMGSVTSFFGLKAGYDIPFFLAIIYLAMISYFLSSVIFFRKPIISQPIS